MQAVEESNVDLFPDIQHLHISDESDREAELHPMLIDEHSLYFKRVWGHLPLWANSHDRQGKHYAGSRSNKKT